MIKLENEHYIRFILLLIKGGTEVLRKTVIKGLEKQNISLNEFLQQKRGDICKSKHITKPQRDILYPPSPHFSDISKWDISLLAYISLDFLSDALSATEKIGVKKIRDMRNDVQAHSNDAAIDTRNFTRIWSELSLMITTLSHTMAEDERQEMVNLISSLSSDQLDIYKAIEELKLLERRDEFFECIQTSLENLQQAQTELAVTVGSCHQDVREMKVTVCQDLTDIKKQLFDMKMEMENRGENTKIVNTMFGRVRVSADEKSIVNTAENILLSASTDSVRKAEPSDTIKAVKEKVDTFVEDVEGIGVTVDNVGEGSIVFTFSCSTLEALIDLIDYFQSPLIERRLDDIARALESVTGHKVQLNAYIPTDPLQDILKKLQIMNKKRTLNFSMTCTGVEGLQHAWNVFEEGAASNSLNNLSKALTEAVGKPVRLETSIDMEQMKKAILSTKEQLELSGEHLVEQSGRVIQDAKTLENPKKEYSSIGSEDENKDSFEPKSSNDEEAEEKSNVRKGEPKGTDLNIRKQVEEGLKRRNEDKDIEHGGRRKPMTTEGKEELVEDEKRNSASSSMNDVDESSIMANTIYNEGRVFGSGNASSLTEKEMTRTPFGNKLFELETRSTGSHGQITNTRAETATDIQTSTPHENKEKEEQQSAVIKTELSGLKTKTKGTITVKEEKETDDKHDDGYDVDTGFKNETAKTKAESWISESEPSILVHFHALISPDFKMDPGVDIVVVRIGDDRFGGWSDNRHQMEFVRKYDTGHKEMIYTLRVPKSRLERNKPLTYKYFVIRNTKTSKGHDRKNIWDHYYIKGNAGPRLNRRLKIPDQVLAESTFPDSWHQYDGVVNRKPKEGVIGWIKDRLSRKQKFQDDVNFSAEVFGDKLIDTLKDRNSSSHDICEATENIELLIRGLRIVYVDDAECYNTKEEMYSVLGRYLFIPVYECFKQHNIKKERTERWWHRRMALQFAVLAVMKSLNCVCIDNDIGPKLCKALLITKEPGLRECREMYFLLRQFPNRRKFYTDALVQFVRRIAQYSEDPSWLYAMPLLHFFSGVCTPFEKKEDGTRHDTDVPIWWGISDIGKDTVDTFKSKTSHKLSIPLAQAIETLEPLFEIDYLLPRTIMSCLNLFDVFDAVSSNRIPVEVCCATLIYFLKVTRPKYWYGTVSNEENLVCKCIGTVLKNLERIYDSPERDVNANWELATEISFDLAKEALLIDSDRNITAYKSVLVFIMCVSQNHRFHVGRKSESAAKELAAKIRLLCGIAVRWLRKQYSDFYRYLEDDLYVWNSFMVPEQLLPKEFELVWNESIATALESKLTSYIGNHKTSTETFVKLYCQKVESFNTSMQKCLHETAYKAMERAYHMEVGTFNEKERATFGILLSKLFDAEWSKMMKNVSDIHDRAFVMKLFQWSPFLHFMNIFFAKQHWDLLHDECKMKLIRTISIIDTRVDELLKGTLTVGDLQLIHRFEETFVKAATLVKQGDREKQVSKEMILKALHVRKKELDEFVSTAKLMVSLTYLCTKLPRVDMSAVDDAVQKQANIEGCRLNEFCHPAVIETVTSVDEFMPEISFKLPDQIQTMLPQMSKYQMSSLFMKIWEGKCEQSVDNCTTFDDVLNIWNPVAQSWKEISTKIEEGTIHFTEFEQRIGRMFGEDYKMIESELKTMEISDMVIQARVDQLKKYRHLEACKAGAKAILSLKKKYEITGNFKEIQIIAGDETSQFEMSKFDETFIDACKFLEGFTSNRAKCIEKFLECQPLIQWLKESMHTSGLKELQVFVDLALISIGDDPYNIGKVQALHSAVNGYAPLIFDLQKDCDFTSLLDLCKIVWQNLEANSKLPKQLEDTGSQLEWLKEIKNAHGSVEITSMMQTESINSDGTYTVGRQASKAGGNDSVLELQDTIKLTVPEEKGKRQQRKYTFAQLQDLQSRLMLVAGKGEKGTDIVERFTMIFDGITRLSKVYLKLYTSGCVLFKEWSARFICDPDPTRPVCAIIDFAHNKDVPQLKGRRSVHEDLKDMIPEIARFMEHCLEEWLKHINDKRDTYQHLNYFTVDQLVILQKELVKFGTEDQPSNLIYPLLSVVKHNCTEDDVIKALMCAKEEIDINEDSEYKRPGDENEVENERNDDDSEYNKRQAFIQNLVEAGQDEGLAIRALDHIDLDDYSQGILWCMEHADSDISEDESMDDKRESTTAGIPPKHVFQGWSQSEVSMQSLIDKNISVLGQHCDVGINPLIKDLQHLWKCFLESVSSNIKDYLSIQHLGIILHHLATRNHNVIERTLPPGFKEGVPNLVVCPSGDVLVTALSIYMADKEQSLPLSDEVLMCTAATTNDEVDIFWRRALFDNSGKIYCLLNAEQLSYNVTEAAERHLQTYMHEVMHRTEVRYHLCVICGSDNVYRTSTMISFLERYKRQAPLINLEKIRKYVANKLVVNNPDDTLRPAAIIDHERSSVRLIKSWRPGVGKTLYKSRQGEALSTLNSGEVKYGSVSIPLQEKEINLHYVIEKLLAYSLKPGDIAARLFHIDIAHEVQEGVDYLLFNMLILGSLTDQTGFVWRKSETDLYLIETMPIMTKRADDLGGKLNYLHQMLNIVPDVICRSPQECLLIYTGTRLQDQKDSDVLFDEKEFASDKYQIPYQYLLRLEENRNFDDVRPERTEGNPMSCLKTLLRYCGLQDPSWSELHHFVWFLSTQLVDFRANSFVSEAAAEDLPGFSTFALKFLVQMSKDFSTRSLQISEESPGIMREPTGHLVMDNENADEGDANTVQLYQMKRTWESSPHPYLFFNSDRMAFTFLGFNIEKSTGNLIDQQTGHVLEKSIMKQNLFDALVRNRVPIQENFDILPRDEKIRRLRSIMGVESKDDPDDSYELTTDNAKKIMAIYMRFRCDIPVIIMGETGCGKTRLVKFLCGLQVPDGETVTNMILMKVHGGTTHKDITRTVWKAEAIANENQKKYGEHMYTVLFFDEANSTEAIGLIKEIMCDKTIEGEPLKQCRSLKIVAACNPYRKHSEELIKKLEQAGLGYHVDSDETTDRLGRVPMRRLVYRVQPLPQSLLPLVWDFGQLNTQVEDLYIRQMVRRHINAGDLPNISRLAEVISAILTASQDYMRLQKDECSFASLRDVERVLQVMSWFYRQSQEKRILFNLMDRKLHVREPENDEEEDIEAIENMGDITRSVILAIGVCYHACLKTREQYRTYIAPYFKAPCSLQKGTDQILEEIDCCQNVFLDHVDLEKNIARNMALKENVFMMVVCIELRVPLFLIGKPGSSKSLAKIIVSDAMRGNGAKKDLFKGMKQAQMTSYQCSPLSTPDSIVGTFRQCAQFQKDNDLNTFVSVVVLDEVGLAEDSPRMPLKTLHPLLEDGCQGDEEPEKYMKVAFIGISNWALDPAKMNRGIVVQRDVPDLEELVNSARGICKTDEGIDYRMEPLIKPMAESYGELFDIASKRMREFFGLRDFYSLVKMVFSFVEKSRQRPTWFQMLYSIKRNFGGLDQVDPVDSFKNSLSKIIPVEDSPRDGDPDCSTTGLIRACLFGINSSQSESRYLLLLTENFGALSIVQQLIEERSEDIRPITIFGSSFRSDQEYTQVCRNINKIKVCMETGNTVVLLNLENLYESLYDALNQYYVYFGDVRYVDLGLGTHRVKCPVHPNFRLIVVAEKRTVYEKFPIPLINRLEKHFLTINTMLSEEKRQLVSRLERWADNFASQRQTSYRNREDTKTVKVGDVFIGYHEDTCSAIILHVWQKFSPSADLCDDGTINKIYEEAKFVLLWCSTPDALARLENSSIDEEEKNVLPRQYFEEQAHNSVLEYLSYMIKEDSTKQRLSQITTHSKLLSTAQISELSQACGIDSKEILLLETLSSFDTEQQFSNKIREHIQIKDGRSKLIVIQCDSGDVNANLIACARYCVMDEIEQMRDELKESQVHIMLLIQLPKVAGGCFTGFQCGKWHSVHIDDLLPEDMHLPSFRDMHGKSVGALLNNAIQSQDETEKDDLLTHESAQADEEKLELDDILFDLENVGYSRATTCDFNRKSSAKLDVEKLILSCVHSALAMVKDRAEERNRETDRVDLVIKYLHQDLNEGKPSFIKGICMHIAKLLQEKETITGLSYKANDWLENEAAKLENINKAGTFRNSCIKVLESKVFPILAGIIAYCDTNENLSILEDTKFSWKTDLWLEIFNTPDVMKLQVAPAQCTSYTKVLDLFMIADRGKVDRNTGFADFSCHEKLYVLYGLKATVAKGKLFEVSESIYQSANIYSHLRYKDFQSPTRSKDLREVTVVSTGSEGHLFCVRMPFSWLFIDKINEVLNLDYPSVDETDRDTNFEDDAKRNARRKVESCRLVLKENRLFKFYDCIQEKQIINEAAEEYVYDVINTVYPASPEEEEFNLVSEATIAIAKDLQEAPSVTSLLDTVIYIHLAVDSMLTRFTYFHELNVLWPECSVTLSKLRTENPGHYVFNGHDITVTAVCVLVESIAPTKGELDVPIGRSKWLTRVHRYRAMVEKVIALYDTDSTLLEAGADKIIRRIKALWTRVMIMKMFIEHVCVSDKENRTTVRFCTPLWSLLGEETDMKNQNSLNAVEKFLKTCYKGAMKEYLGSIVKCSDCEKILEGIPISLPCKDVLCDRCYNDLIASKRNTCAKCRRVFAEDWSPEKASPESNADERLRDYQKKCNAFFMDVVSTLSFADNTAPSKEVVEKLLTYAFWEAHGKRQQTKNLSVFDTGLDPNPVFRSFLLQLLLKTSERNVIENLERYVEEAKAVLREASDKEEMYIKLSLLVIHCVEDHLMQTDGGRNSGLVISAMKALQTAAKTIETDGFTAIKLYGLSCARMGLRIAADSIAIIVKQNSQDNATMKLIETAKQFCQSTKSDWPRKYMVKCLCRFYGIDVYQAACLFPDLEWIQIMDMRKEGYDRYIVCGAIYTELREAVTKTVLAGKTEILSESTKNLHEENVQVEPLLQLAIYRDITSSFLYPQEQRQITPEIVLSFSKFAEECDSVSKKELFLSLLKNQLVPKHLVTREGDSIRTQGIQSLIVHFLIVMTHIETERTLLHPLLTICIKPQMCTDFFLPTMPQDDLEDVKEALLASRVTVPGADKTALFYRCPNGHPYVIGDCGKPYVTSKCQCGAEIGGTAHKLLITNTEDKAKDLTVTGHILGRAENRGPGPKPERLLTPAQCATIRLLLHMAMYIGAGKNLQGIQTIIKPDIETDIVEDFLWQHIQLDVDDIQRATSKSVDDVLLFMHCIISGVMIRNGAVSPVADDVYSLSTKRGRQDWEVAFTALFLKDQFVDMDTLLQQHNNEIVNDRRLGTDPLLCLLFETESKTESSSLLQEAPRVWRYRTPISLQHLRQRLEAETGSVKAGQRTHTVLQLFLKEEYHLRAIRYIPSILRLHRALFQKYRKKLDKAEASKRTVLQLKREEIAGTETSKLLKDFAEAWDLCRESLEFYMCATEAGGTSVPMEYSRCSINDDTPVYMLLPATEDAGLCSYILLDFLMRKQNDFLDKYVNETGRKSESIAKVSPQEITSAHLISYDPQHELLPLVLANCQYTFKMGEGTSIEYDFARLERQLMDRFLFSKSRIDVRLILQIELMVYRTEFTNASVFNKLSEHISQERLHASIKTQICNEMKSLPDICQSLYNLDIAISFLSSTGGLPDNILHDYMKKTLQMETTFSSQKAQQMCRFKHVQSLWLLLSLLKSKTMTDNQQQREFTFETVQNIFDVNLTPDEIENLNHFMKDLSVDKLGVLVEVLHEFILLRVAVKQNTDDEDYTDITENQMKDWVLAYIDETDNPLLDTVILDAFPEEIKLKHSVHTWVAAYRMLKGKQSGTYMHY